MRFLKVIFICFIASILLFCTARKKAEYDFPEQMLPHVKEGYLVQCDKGQILYNINCSGCHSTKVGRKTYIPDFSQDQLTGYTLRTSNKMHSVNLPDSTLTTEELGQIMIFLTYKKRN